MYAAQEENESFSDFMKRVMNLNAIASKASADYEKFVKLSKFMSELDALEAVYGPMENRAEIEKRNQELVEQEAKLDEQRLDEARNTLVSVGVSGEELEAKLKEIEEMRAMFKKGFPK